MTRQSVHGRANDGGLRIGKWKEMVLFHTEPHISYQNHF